jgi:hypothetical protein
MVEYFVFTKQQPWCPSPTQAGHISILPHHHQVGVKYSLPLSGHHFCPGEVPSSHQLCCPVWFSPEQLMCHTHVAELQSNSDGEQQG